MPRLIGQIISRAALSARKAKPLGTAVPTAAVVHERAQARDDTYSSGRDAAVSSSSTSWLARRHVRQQAAALRNCRAARARSPKDVG
jgi:hypothetical protein